MWSREISPLRRGRCGETDTRWVQRETQIDPDDEEAYTEIPPEERHNLVGGNPRLSDARSDGPTVTPTGM